MPPEKKHLITISGLPGSGKSSTAELLAKVLRYRAVSSGEFFRDMARERGLSVEEMSELARKDPTIDPALEARVREIAEKENDLVIESRAAAYILPEAFKVFLKLDLQTAAERVYRQITTEGRDVQTASSVEEAYEKAKRRLEAEKERYLEHYHLDYTDESLYDAVIDTAAHPLDEVVHKIINLYSAWLLTPEEERGEP